MSAPLIVRTVALPIDWKTRSVMRPPPSNQFPSI